MKIALLLMWLAIPVAWAAWHYGPGQETLKLDASDGAIAEAQQASEADAKLEAYDAAIAALPKTEVAQARRLRLARAQTMMASQNLPQARLDLDALYQEMKDDTQADATVLSGVQEELASAKYYLTWLMRLEGQPQEVWEPEAESSRQHFRLLAENAKGDKTRYQEKLESSIKLARMDLTELQGLPLPSKCKGCCSGKCKKPGQKPGEKKPQDARAAGNGPPADNEGS
jgi:hypothetical protein